MRGQWAENTQRGVHERTMGREYTKESSYVEEIRCLVVFLLCFKIFFDVGLCCLTINRGRM